MLGRAEPQRLVEAFGAPFRMLDPGVGFKKHPSNYFAHRAIDAALGLRRDHRIDPAMIERVEVTFPRFEYINRPQPVTGLDGQFSVQYTSAVALLDGEITVDSFANERRFAADVVRLLPRMELRFDDNIPADFNSMHVAVKVALNDGRSFEQRVDKLTGWCGVPLTREERLRKFYSCALQVLDRATADRLSEVVDQLERLKNTAPIADIVRTPCS